MNYQHNTQELPPLATFDGRLQLTSFTFGATPSSSSAPSRRSPRKASSIAPGSGSAAIRSPTPPIPKTPTRTAAATSLKRKASSSSSPSPSPSPTRSPTAPPSPSPSSSSASASASVTKRVCTAPNPKARIKNKASNAYAPPLAYAHLPQLLPDALAPGLLIMFVGLNPGVRTAVAGHAYAHPSNHFWRLLHRSGITPRLCAPEEDAQMPELYSLGLTNIVSRPSRCGAELSKREMDAGVAVLEEKARKWRPEVVCFVGKSIWESVERVLRARSGRGKEAKVKVFKYGWKDDLGGFCEERSGGWEGAKMFAATSTSGLAAALKIEEKERIWSVLGCWARQRRLERGDKREELGEGETTMDIDVATVKQE